MFFIAVAYLGSYRLIQSLQDKPALYIWWNIMLVMLFLFLRKEKESNT
jgi:membrane-bound acyltransferase YfiQ involved in biofilm formation